MTCAPFAKFSTELPQNERLGIVAAESVFEPEAAPLRKAKSCEPSQKRPVVWKDAREWVVLCSVCGSINTAWRWLNVPRLGILSVRRTGSPREARAERQRFGKAVIDGTLAVAHSRVVREASRFWWMWKSLGHANEAVVTPQVLGRGPVSTSYSGCSDRADTAPSVRQFCAGAVFF